MWKAAKVTAAVVAIAAALVSATIWSRRDPLSFLPRGATGPVVHLDRIEHRSGRVFEHVSLSDARLGSTGFTLNLPDPLPTGKLPVVIVLGGLGTGEHNIRAIGNAGNNVVVGYDWPLA